MFHVKRFSNINMAIALIEKWGYPRDLDERDVNSEFLVIGEEDGFIWFDEFSDGLVAFHIVFDPSSRGKAFTMGVWRSIVGFCISNNWVRLYAMNVGEVMTDYALRLGFEHDERVFEWLYFPLRETNG